MQKAHSNINWENYPSTDTPINETNLNAMDNSIDTIDDRVIVLDTSKANQSDLLQSVKGITYNTTTGVFTFTWQNGTTLDVDLNVEKIPVSFSMSPQGVITMTTADGTQYTADVSSLIKTYTFSDTADIDFTVTTDASGNKTVTAIVKNGAITREKIDPDYLAQIDLSVSQAQGYATASSNSATDSLNSSRDSEAWAVGKRNNVDVPSTDPQYQNNSKFYADYCDDVKDDCNDIKDDCDDIKTQIETMVGQTQFSVDFTTGELIYTNESTYNFTVNETTGNLEWEVVA